MGEATICLETLTRSNPKIVQSVRCAEVTGRPYAQSVKDLVKRAISIAELSQGLLLVKNWNKVLLNLVPSDLFG